MKVIVRKQKYGYREMPRASLCTGCGESVKGGGEAGAYAIRHQPHDGVAGGRNGISSAVPEPYGDRTDGSLRETPSRGSGNHPPG